MTANGLSPAHTAKGHLQRALLDLLRARADADDGTLPTSGRFLFYELVTLGIIDKSARKGDNERGRRSDQNMSDALIHLREAGIVPWDWIEDETRKLEEWQTSPTVADYVLDAVDYATIDRWAGRPAPLILCESRSLAGVLRGIANLYTCPLASTNGQSRGFLVSKVAPSLQADQRVLYLGDFDWCGAQIEENTRRTLEEFTGVRERPWERLALTAAQVEEFQLPVISKPDRRYRPVKYYDAVETEALGQSRIMAVVRDRLDELMPEPIGDVVERQRRQRAAVAEQLRQLGGTT